MRGGLIVYWRGDKNAKRFMPVSSPDSQGKLKGKSRRGDNR
jgi:hypothetical protein